MPTVKPVTDLKARRRMLLADALDEAAARRFQTRFRGDTAPIEMSDVMELSYGTTPDGTPIEEVAAFEYDRSKPGGFLTQLNDRLKGRNVPVTPRISQYRIAGP